MSCKFDVYVDHLKVYIGDNSLRPCVGLERIPMNVSDDDGSEDSQQRDEHTPEHF